MKYPGAYSICIILITFAFHTQMNYGKRGTDSQGILQEKKYGRDK